MLSHLVEQGLAHHRRRDAPLVEPKLRAGGVVGANGVVHRVPDASHVRRLGQVIATTSGPDKNVICEVACHAVSILDITTQDFSQRSDVLVVPGVAVSNARALGYACDLVTV